MIKKLFVAGLMALTIGCAYTKKKPVAYAKIEGELIRYICYKEESFSVVSYENNKKSLSIEHWGKEVHGCFAAHYFLKKSEENAILALFRDKNCDGKYESYLQVSEKSINNPKKVFQDILFNLRNRKKTKNMMAQCL